MTSSPTGVSLPRRPSFPRKTTSRKPGQDQLAFEFDFNAPTKISGVAPKREAPSAQTVMKGRNLRALSVDQVKEPLPPMIAFDSSRVAEAGYSSSSKTLYVRFVDGTPWNYFGVEQNEWKNFKRSASPGKYINRILNGKNYSRGSF